MRQRLTSRMLSLRNYFYLDKLKNESDCLFYLVHSILYLNKAKESFDEICISEQSVLVIGKILRFFPIAVFCVTHFLLINTVILVCLNELLRP